MPISQPVSTTFQPSNFAKLEWHLYRFEISSIVRHRSRKRTVLVLSPIAGAAVMGVGNQSDENAVARPLSPTENVLMGVGMKRKARQKEIVSFMNTMGKSMLAGISVRESLRRCAGRASTPYLRGVIGCLAYYASTQGGEISKAMALFPNVFPEMVTAQIEAGEMAGNLRESFELLAGAMKEDLKLSKKLGGIMVYPAFLGIGITGLFVLMQMFVIPRMMPMFTAQLTSGLPLSTRLVMGISDFFQNHWYVVAAGVAGAIYVFTKRRQVAAQHWWQRGVLLVPGVGGILRYGILIRSLRALALLLDRGVPLNRAFEITARVSGNVVYADYFMAVYTRVRSGEELDIAFFAERWRIGAEGLDISQQIQLGVANGNEGKALLELVDMLHTELTVKLETLPTIMNFAMLLMVAPFFMLIALAVIQPSVQMATDTLKSMGGTR